MNRSRLELAVLVFPDFNQNFSVVDDLQTPEPLPRFTEVQTAAAEQNPDLRAALAALQEANQEVGGRVEWISAFAQVWIISTASTPISLPLARSIRHGMRRNLGYAATATLQLPVWNWGANRSKVKQADLRRDQARVELSFAQRQLLARSANFL